MKLTRHNGRSGKNVTYFHTFSFADQIPKNSFSLSIASYSGPINRSICFNTEENSGLSSPGPG